MARTQSELGLRFWGVRGSVGVGGAGTAVFGGHTSCMEIFGGRNRVIVDAGTGIVPYGMTVNAQAGDHFDLLLTHLHHDHVMGLMLFGPCFVPGVSIDIYCGNLGGQSPEEPLQRLFSPPLFPITLDTLPAKLRFIGFSAGERLDIADLTVHTCPLNHPDGATGYRFEADGRSVAILTDMEHEGDAADPAPALVAFSSGADLIVYDATFDDDDYPKFRGWGHSTWEAGVALAKAAHAKALACFHHAPEYDDARIGSMEQKLRRDFPRGFFAREGQSFLFSQGTPVPPAGSAGR